MSKNLVIVESPAKAKSINKILGKDYTVKACMGHVRDLPQRKLGVDIENNFEPEYVKIRSKSKVVNELQSAVKSADAVYLAPDPDREGEAIAWHLLALLDNKKAQDTDFYRVTYNEITAPAIREAFERPGRIDQRKVDSQQARRVLDRIVGYQVSPLLWRRVRGGQSAGRVQSVALRLVCEHEEAIRQFVPEEYWLLGAKVRKQVDPREPFRIKLAKINDEKAAVKTEAQAQSVLDALAERELFVSAVNRREISKRPQPPYITSTLQQAGSRFFSFSPSRTMRVAQELYEGIDFGEGPLGLITYMRTDSFNVSQVAQKDCLAFVRETYGEAYVPERPNVYRSKGGAQEAHEAVRPTDVRRTPESLQWILSTDQLKVYRVIWERFVASQMTPAKIAQRTVEVEAPPPERGETYLFRASASEVVFPGYMKVTGGEKQKSGADREQEENGEGAVGDEYTDTLPPLEEGERLDLLEWLKEQKFTQPPGRYTESSLIRVLEENGIGRPSTYAQIMSTLLERKYVEKEKRALKPTDTGEKVNAFLVEHLPALFDVKFTAEMEESLDEIEQGSVEWHRMLAEFYEKFQAWLTRVRGPDANPELVQKLLDLTERIQEWAPEVQRGKRKYSDKRFVSSLRKQLEKGERPISARQLKALKRMICNYRDQIPSLEERAAELEMEEELAEAKRPPEPPREATQRKLALLKSVTFHEPRKVGKRTYDDRAFCESLRQQVESGKRLTENQIRYLDKLLIKYSEQIADFDALAEELGLHQSQEPHQQQAEPVLKLFEQVKEWKPPVQRGKRTWDDRKFYESLASQFAERKELSYKQLASLKKMAKRYADQIPDYDRRAEEYGLPPRKKKGQDE